MELGRASMQRTILQRYGHTPSMVLPILTFGTFGLLVSIALITHPVSLAIICSTSLVFFFLFVIWRTIK
jgi:hypothetical protein